MRYPEDEEYTVIRGEYDLQSWARGFNLDRIAPENLENFREA